MNTSFILRFEEFCADDNCGKPPSGTKTVTNFRSEASDSDWNYFSYDAIAPKPIMVGTKTKIAAPGGGSDNDFGHRAFQATPLETIPVSGTKTVTRARAEESDNDEDRRQFSAIPSCFLS